MSRQNRSAFARAIRAARILSFDFGTELVPDASESPVKIRSRPSGVLTVPESERRLHLHETARDTEPEGKIGVLTVDPVVNKSACRCECVTTYNEGRYS